MLCRFKGTFTEQEQRRIAQAVRTVEHLRTESVDDPNWVVLQFERPYKGYRYGAIRLNDGHAVYAYTARGLAVAVESLRDGMLRLRSRALCEGSRQAIHQMTL